MVRNKNAEVKTAVREARRDRKMEVIVAAAYFRLLHDGAQDSELSLVLLNRRG